jgi:UDP-N-acetylglucosamine--N-acetylmuramyl-(pentapeptide) pyrophosphoryl-undecaprenol N-acetylglucosamine transferase
MRIIFTGGVTGGHFYPIIAIAEEMQALIKEKRLLNAEIYYMAPTPYNQGLLYEHGIQYETIRAGKIRRYFSLLNVTDLFKTFWGVITATWRVYRLYPDVVFGKGGFGSFPVLLAARILRIPVIIHESDSEPGKVNKWAGKFAVSVAISYPEAAKFFPKEKVVFTGNPVRRDIVLPISTGAREFLKLEENIPVLLILGGSQGSSAINDAIIEALPQFVNKYEVIHQTGAKNIFEAERTAEAVLFNSDHKERYKPFDYLDALALRMSAGVASIVISRAGSTIFEIAAWGLPSIVIPIPGEVSHDQEKNAFAYARAGACEVVEEKNLTPHILLSEIDRILTHDPERAKMQEAAKQFYKPDAAKKIAEEILKLGLAHEIKS